MRKAMMHLAQFLCHSPTYHSLAMWRHPRTAAAGYDWARPELYQHIARVCERGRFDMVFFADLNYISDTCMGSLAPALRNTTQAPERDPIPGDGGHEGEQRILILQQYAKLIPKEFDEAAQIDGAGPWQVFRHLYLPLTAPALAAVGTFALLFAWNEYIYQYILLSSERKMTVAVAIAQFFDADEAPWNYMMATAILYALPPVAIFFALRRWVMAGMALGGVKA